MQYKLINHPMTNELVAIKLIDDNMNYTIPLDPDNADYKEYLEWVAEGNTPEEAD